MSPCTLLIFDVVFFVSEGDGVGVGVGEGDGPGVGESVGAAELVVRRVVVFFNNWVVVNTDCISAGGNAIAPTMAEEKHTITAANSTSANFFNGCFRINAITNFTNI